MVESPYEPCNECLNTLDYGIVAWERHLERDHYDPGKKQFFDIDVPFCSVLNKTLPEHGGDPAVVHLNSANQIIDELKDAIPVQSRHQAIMAVKLAVALERERQRGGASLGRFK